MTVGKFYWNGDHNVKQLNCVTPAEELGFASLLAGII